MSNQPETNETPATGYTPVPRKVGLPRFFELLGRDLWAFYRASFLCLLGFLPGTALAVFGQMGGSALLTVLGGLLGGLFGSSGPAIDCDASAFVLQNGKLADKKDIVYFGNLKHYTGTVQHLSLIHISEPTRRS